MVVNKLRFILLIAFFLVSTVLTYAQTHVLFIETVYNQLLLFSDEEDVLERLIIGRLTDGETTTWTLTGDEIQNKNIEIIGVCDNDCDDLDLRMRKTEGIRSWDEVDELPDALPLINTTTDGDDVLQIQVDMHSCEQVFCYYGLAVLFE